MVKIADLLAAGQTFSFEFFPPKTDAAARELEKALSELEPLRPSFVSVTYGAGGSTRERTHEIVVHIRRDTAMEPMAHLSCIAHTAAELEEVLTGYAAAGIENILALAGDPPKEVADKPADFHYASELVTFVRSVSGFSVGVAAHPELHPRSRDRASDRDRLAEKLELADFGITQFFFRADDYYGMLDDLAERGCTTPVIPGIMPISNLSSVQRMAEMSGAEVPVEVRDRVFSAGDDPEAVRQVGVEIATELCRELLDRGVPGLHFYTLNRSTATREIYKNLGL